MLNTASIRPSRPIASKTLLLMRHAKSSWKDETLLDIDRPLNGRGRRAAESMAPLVAAWQPQWIGCSVAVRTRQTLGPVIEHMNNPADITLTPALYESTEAAYLRLVRALPTSIDRALIIGHNPTLADLCTLLIGRADPQTLERLTTKLPTGALIALECPIARWSDLAPGTTTLLDMNRPADLTH